MRVRTPDLLVGSRLHEPLRYRALTTLNLIVNMWSHNLQGKPQHIPVLLRKLPQHIQIKLHIKCTMHVKCIVYLLSCRQYLLCAFRDLPPVIKDVFVSRCVTYYLDLNTHAVHAVGMYVDL
jgi:hypothetical protein